MEKIRILFVCLGNICRSPAAEGAFRKLIHEEKLTNYFVLDSAGTSGYHDGELADPRTRKVADSRGIQLTHLSRRLLLSDFSKFDYLIAMDQENVRTMKSFPNTSEFLHKVFLFRGFEKINSELEVPDPYYGNLDAFENVQNIVETASVAFLTYLKNQYPRLLQ
jgi:protein-tyrosine phosphatase